MTSFLPPIPNVGDFLRDFWGGTPIESEPETVDLTPPRAEVPSLEEAVTVLRREVRDSVACQGKGPLMIVVASYPELDVVLCHVEAQIGDAS